MVNKIIWTELAIEDYHQVVHYLLEEWNEQVALNFILKVEAFERDLVITPLSGQVAYKDSTVRGKLVTRHNKIYYRITGDFIQILQMRDTRLFPGKNPFE